MLTRVLFGGCVGAVLCLFVAGCGGGSKAARASGAVTGSDTKLPRMEDRIEAHARYAAGVVHELNERPAEAVADYYRAAMIDSANETLVLEVTRKLLHLKEAEKSLEILEKATSQAGAGAPLFTRLAVAHGFLGHTNESVKAAQRAVSLDPASMPARQQLAQILLQQGRVEPAMDVLREALTMAKAGPEDWLRMAEVCLSASAAAGPHRNDLRELGGQFLDRAVEGDVEVNNPMVLQRLADANLFLGRTEQASDLYVRLLSRFPQLPGVRERLIDLYLRQQDLSKASNQLETIVRDNPTNVRAQYLLGSLAYDAKNLEKARDHFGKVLILNPDFEQAYYDLAGTQINLDQSEQALETLDKAREKFKLRFVTELYSALAQSRLKHYEKAVRHYEAAEIVARATETNRLTHVFYFQIGAAYERNKQYREAESYFRKCLRMAPEFSEAMNYLGYMWAERGENLEEALSLIEKAVELEPDNAAYLDSLAWVLFKLNRPQEALEPMLKAVELSEEPDAVLFDHLGDIYAAVEQMDKAREAWSKALEMEPNEAIERKLASPDGTGSDDG